MKGSDMSITMARTAVSAAPGMIGPALVLLVLSAVGAQAQPTGVWLDEKERGAVEITSCGEKLCGHIVWLKDPKNSKFCGRQILGDAQPIKSGVWDKGWIFSPEDDRKYDVELEQLNNDKLQVKGYLGTKLFSETLIWRRSAAQLPRCNEINSTVAASTQPKGVEEPKESKGSDPSTSDPGRAAKPSSQVATIGSQASDAQLSKHDDEDDDLPAFSFRRERKEGSDICNVQMGDIKMSFPCPK